MSSLTTLIQDLADKKVTSVALVERCFAAIEEHDSTINAFVRTYKEEALEQAKESDARREKGESLSPLDGIPVGIKDNFSYKDHITSAASTMLKDYTASYNATVVTKLLARGVIILGQLNMDEFAMGSSGENSAFGPTKNPLDISRVPGGSSSGAAAAVTAGMVPLSFGSDTGGSIRQPAAFCGVAGLKPTYGAVSRYGLLAMASSLDQIGPFAQDVAGVKTGYEAIKGFDVLDSTSHEDGKELEPKKQYTVGIPKQFVGNGLDPRIQDALDATVRKLEDAGHTIVRDIDLPLLEQSVAMYYLIMPAEVSANLARYDGIRFGHKATNPTDSRSHGFGPEVKRRIMLGTFVLSAGYADAYYKRAQAARAGLTESFLQTFKEVDVILGPTAPELPFKIGEKSSDPLAMYLSDVYTIPVNLAGLPGLTVPVQWVEEEGKRLPIGLQLIGKPWSEPQLFDLGQLIEYERNPHANQITR